jgi:hypothetical protein
VGVMARSGRWPWKAVTGSWPPGDQCASLKSEPPESVRNSVSSGPSCGLTHAHNDQSATDVGPSVRVVYGHEDPNGIDQQCNLARALCYVYELRETSWRHEPGVITGESALRLAERIADPARTHALPGVRHDLRLLRTALPQEELRRVLDVPREDPHPAVDLRHADARRPDGLAPDDLYGVVGVPQGALR